MSSRALRKVQREREEQERRQQLEGADGVESEEDVPVSRPQKSAFAMLEEDDADQDAVKDDINEVEDEQPSDEPVVAAKPKASSKKKKKKKKGKTPNAGTDDTTSNINDGNLDEIDKALKELRMNGSSAGHVGGVSAETDEMSRLLAIETSHLRAQTEMRRLFGQAALDEHDDEEQPQNENFGGNRRQQRRVQQVGLAQALRGNQDGRRSGLQAMALKRNIFVQGKEEWPSGSSGGLGMEVEEKRADGTVLYRFVHNSGYRDVQHQFGIAVESMDPDRLVLLLQQNPYHVATLLQVSEIAKQERNHAVAGDLLERALFSFGRAVHSTFSKKLTEGKARLDFRRPQNREFWLATWRYMQNLSMRATWRTVYEWAKLLLQLSPDDDPYAMWLVLDQYALRARQDLDYLNLSRSSLFKDRIRGWPNVELSQALAEHRAGNKSKGQQALFKAVGRFPWVVARLMQELNVDPPPAIWGQQPRTDSEKLQAEMYATQMKDIWGTPETSALLMEISAALPSGVEPIDVDVTSEISENVARHVLLSDTPALIGIIPRHFTERLTSSSDPLPPSDTHEPVAEGDPAFRNRGQQSAEEIETELAELQSWLSSLDSQVPLEADGSISPEQVMQMLRDNGITQDELVARVRRIAEVQGMRVTTAYAQSDEEARHIPGGFDSEPGFDEEEHGRRARVEDASDDED